MKKLVWIFAAYAAAQQSPQIQLVITAGERPKIAVPDFRGAGDAQRLMGAFNQTLWSDLEGSGIVTMVSKSMYPPAVPQQPSDFTTPGPPVVETPRPRNAKQKQAPAPPQTGGGRWLADWSGPPVNTKYLAFGYTAVTNGVLVLRGFLYDVTNPGAPQVIAQQYLGSVDETGSRKVAHEFAADILKAFGGQSLFNTHIYFTSDRTGSQEIWVMDPDGHNQRQLTNFKFLSMGPSVSPDGQKVAFTSYRNTNPGIFVFSVDPVRDLRFYNQRASVNSTPSFTPDGKQIVYASSAPNDKCCRIFIANLDGTGFRALTSVNKIEVEPKVNPKGGDILFVSGRSGPQQIYKMNMDGADVERITEGTGEASNPSWHPNGKIMAYAWTRGYSTGAWNIFIMDVASRKYDQLTHGEGKNENPSWSPSGTHLAFASTRTGKYQIYSMPANGSPVQQLTSLGSNTKPFRGSNGSNWEARFMFDKRKITVIGLALSLTLFAAGCKKKAPPPPPPPPPAPAEAPKVAPAPAAPRVAGFSAEPTSIQRGQSSTLRWEVSGAATSVSIDNAIGTVQGTGSQSVSPANSTTYTLTASGPGGSVTSSVTVAVTSPPPPPTIAPVAPRATIEQRLLTDVQDVFFDYDKSDVRSDARDVLSRNASAIKSILADFPSAVIIVEGHADERGSAEYNLGLGDQRAGSAKEFLVQLGVPGDRLRPISYGKERPQCTSADEAAPGETGAPTSRPASSPNSSAWPDQHAENGPNSPFALRVR